MTSIADRVADKLLGGLWTAQLEEWPDSVRLTDEEANKELKKRGYLAPTSDYLRRQFSPGMFYLCGEGQVNFGFRYGPLPHHYLSY